MDKHDLFFQHGIDEEQFSKLGVTWVELCKIHAEYSRQLPEYLDAAKALAERLHSERSIHSIKYRVKDPEHLVEKIIRKMAQGAVGGAVSYDNYRSEIQDLVGVRALHLFKEDWLVIHNFLVGNWEIISPPKANYKAGDPDEILGLYSDMGCELYEHPNGYRSVHYNLRIKTWRLEMVAEVQVRTLFEEAWSEIDHHFRYRWKNGVGSGEADQYLGVINNLAYNADALASYLNKLKPAQSTPKPANDGAAPGSEGDGAAPGSEGDGVASGSEGDGAASRSEGDGAAPDHTADGDLPKPATDGAASGAASGGATSGGAMPSPATDGAASGGAPDHASDGDMSKPATSGATSGGATSGSATDGAASGGAPDHASDGAMPKPATGGATSGVAMPKPAADGAAFGVASDGAKSSPATDGAASGATSGGTMPSSANDGAAPGAPGGSKGDGAATDGAAPGASGGYARVRDLYKTAMGRNK